MQNPNPQAQKTVELSRAQQDAVLLEKAKAALAAERDELTAKVRGLGLQTLKSSQAWALGPARCDPSTCGRACA